MDPLAEQEIERACAALMSRYAWLVDVGPARDVVDLFGPSATFTSPDGRTLRTREEIMEMLVAHEARTRVSVHSTSNVIIDVVDGDNATGTSVFTVYGAEPDPGDPDATLPLSGPTLVGRYADTFVRTDEGWRFDERHITVIFKRE